MGFILSDWRMWPYAVCRRGLAATFELSTNRLGDVFKSSHVNLGVNLIGGVMMDLQGIRPFVEGRFTLGKHQVFQYLISNPWNSMMDRGCR